MQEQPKNPFRFGFLGIFDKKEEECKTQQATARIGNSNRRESTSRLTETGSGNNRHAQKVFYYAGLM